MKKIIVAFLSAVLFVSLNSIYAQTNTNDEGAKKTKIKVNRDVMMADELMNSGSYYNAIDIYLQQYQKDPDNYVSNQLSHAYFAARDYKNAETWFKKTWTAAPAQYPSAQYYYALSMKMNGKYELASAEFKAFNKTKMKGSMAPVLKRQAKNEQKGCDLALLLMADPLKVNIDHLNKNINQNYTDFSPVYDPTNNKLVYASLVSEQIIDLGASKKVELKSHIYTADKQGENWGKGTEMQGPMNNANTQTGNGSYSPDGKRFYYTECAPNDSLKMICKIFMTEYKGGQWSKSKELTDVNATSGYTTTHPAVGLYKGKEILYFSSNRAGSVGGMDIWYSEIKNNGLDYSSPQNCGRKINTTGDEITPFYSKTEDMVYFSSNGLINIGGLDVYKTKGGLKSWDAPLNLGFPVNSSVDDFYYSLDTKKARTGFLVSNRPGGYSVKGETCCDDIYQFQYIIPPVFTIMGKVIDKNTGAQIEGAAVTLLKSDASQADIAVSASKNMFTFYRGTEYEKYTLTSILDGYYKGEARISTIGLTEDDTVYVDIPMEKIPPHYTVEVKNIYYELDKADLRPESYTALDSLYNILSANPSIIVELGAHTDSRNTDAYNLDLSQRRAQSVVNYLRSKGIDSARMIPKGYGETTPKTLGSATVLPSGKTVPEGTVLTESFINKYKGNKGDYEFLHQINRRTEFTIIGEIPNTNIKYDQAQIDAMKALEREKMEKEQSVKNQKLMELQQVEGDDAGNQLNQNTNQQQNNTTTNTQTQTNTAETKTNAAETKTDTKKTKEETKAQPKAGVDAAIIKKGNMYEGNALLNGTEASKYILNPNPTLNVVMISDELFVKMRDAGLIKETDIKNDKPTTLSDGSTAKGDVFGMKTIQLGDMVMENVDVKINPTITQNMIVGIKIVQDKGCSFDTKSLKYKCK